MADEIKNIFISHIHEDDDGLTKLKELANKHGLAVRDASINSANPNNAKSPEYIKNDILAPGINWAGTLVVYITPDTKDSEYVNWEIEYAHKANKRIVGVWAAGEKDCDIPKALGEYGHALVGWNGENIVDAISGKSDKWYKCTGEPQDYRPIKRFSC